MEETNMLHRLSAQGPGGFHPHRAPCGGHHHRPSGRDRHPGVPRPAQQGQRRRRQVAGAQRRHHDGGLLLGRQHLRRRDRREPRGDRAEHRLADHGRRRLADQVNFGTPTATTYTLSTVSKSGTTYTYAKNLAAAAGVSTVSRTCLPVTACTFKGVAGRW